METEQHATKKNQWVNDEIKEKIEKYLEANDNENTTIQKKKIYEMLQKQFLDGSSQKHRPSSKNKKNLNLTYHLKSQEKKKKKEQSKPKISRRKEIVRIREEIYKREIKRQQKKSIKPRAGALKG